MGRTAHIYVAAALAEIGGCYAVRAWWRLGRSAWWLVPGVLALLLLGSLLAQVESDAAGRAFAAHGEVYIAASLGWLWQVEQLRADRFDLAGAALCLLGAAVIIAAPRAGA